MWTLSAKWRTGLPEPDALPQSLEFVKVEHGRTMWKYMPYVNVWSISAIARHTGHA